MYFTDEYEYFTDEETFHVTVEGNYESDEEGGLEFDVHSVEILNDSGEALDEEHPAYDEIMYDAREIRMYEPEIHATDMSYYDLYEDEAQEA